MSRIPLKVSPIVSTEWLSQKLNCDKIRVLDASWHLPVSKRNAQTEFNHNHINGASFFDIDECADKSTGFSHMLPHENTFNDYVGNLGIDNNTHVVIYDNNTNFGMFSAPRAWWTFQVFGHKLVSVLDGGLPKWISEDRLVTDEIISYPPKVFKGMPDSTLIINYDDVVKNIESPKFQLVDLRPNGRFLGQMPEPRPGVKSGHILNSSNLPFADLIDANSKTFKKPDALKDIISAVGIDVDKPIVATCGSGTTACMLSFASAICNLPINPVYDGSWQEWYVKANPKHKKCVPI